MNDLIKYFPFLAIAAPIALFWNQAKNFFLKIISFFWKRRKINDYNAIEFYKYFKKECKSLCRVHIPKAKDVSREFIEKLKADFAKKC
jgi:hypothetical protein